MMAMCVPIFVGVVLIATGAVRPGFLILPLGCAAMMYFMIRSMNHDD